MNVSSQIFRVFLSQLTPFLNYLCFYVLFPSGIAFILLQYAYHRYFDYFLRQSSVTNNTDSRKRLDWECSEIVGRRRREMSTNATSFIHRKSMLQFWSNKENHLVKYTSENGRTMLTGEAGIPDYKNLWSFLLVGSPNECPSDWQICDIDESWAPIQLPNHWQLQGFDIPIYTNTTYPFQFDPPRARRTGRWVNSGCDLGLGCNNESSRLKLHPAEPGFNATGLYRCNFSLTVYSSDSFSIGDKVNSLVSLSAVTATKQVTKDNSDLYEAENIHTIVESASAVVITSQTEVVVHKEEEYPYRIYLVFAGVDSSLSVWLNGVYIGYSQDSCLPAEFDITDACKAVGANTTEPWWSSDVQHKLAVQVTRWCDGSYLEDQDKWWLSGIYREVYIEQRPIAGRLADFEFSCSVYTPQTQLVPPQQQLQQPQSDSDGFNTTAMVSASISVAVLAEDVRTITERKDSNSRNRKKKLSSTVQSAAAHAVRIELWSDEQLHQCGAAYETASKKGGLDSNERIHNNNNNNSGKRISSRRNSRSGSSTATELPSPQPVCVLFSELQPGSKLPRRAAADSSIAAVRGTHMECADVDVSYLQSPGVASVSATIQNPVLWTAESPYLYTLMITLYGSLEDAQNDRNDIHSESHRVGIRSVSIEGPDNVLQVNGCPLTIAGINRHEFHPGTGRAVSKQSMWEDAVLLKKLNFNAVRSSHYPQHPYWLEVCDAIGLYVIDEANIETHGFQVLGQPVGYLADLPEWRGAMCSRVSRMYERDKNHACIIGWSLGNESGYGATHDIMASWLRLRDPYRFVQYESGGACTSATDIICPMYLRPNWCKEHSIDDGDHLRRRPVILCEYAHAMGNSGGCLSKYWEAFRDPQYPRLQGGFIWDFVDQGLLLPNSNSNNNNNQRDCDDDDKITTLANNNNFESFNHDSNDKHTSTNRVPPPHKCYGYGGDFGDFPNTKQFCCNGIASPARSLYPVAYEAAHLQAPIEVLLLFNGDEDPCTTAITAAAAAEAMMYGNSRRSSIATIDGSNDNEGDDVDVVDAADDSTTTTSLVVSEFEMVAAATAAATGPFLIISNRRSFTDLSDLQLIVTPYYHKAKQLAPSSSSTACVSFPAFMIPCGQVLPGSYSKFNILQLLQESLRQGAIATAPNKNTTEGKNSSTTDYENKIRSNAFVDYYDNIIERSSNSSNNENDLSLIAAEAWLDISVQTVANSVFWCPESYEVLHTSLSCTSLLTMIEDTLSINSLLFDNHSCNSIYFDTEKHSSSSGLRRSARKRCSSENTVTMNMKNSNNSSNIPAAAVRSQSISSIPLTTITENESYNKQKEEDEEEDEAVTITVFVEEDECVSKEGYNEVGKGGLNGIVNSDSSIDSVSATEGSGSSSGSSDDLAIIVSWSNGAVARVGQHCGRLLSWHDKHSQALLATPIDGCIYRAPTDNDRGGAVLSYYSQWKEMGLDALVRKQSSSRSAAAADRVDNAHNNNCPMDKSSSSGKNAITSCKRLECGSIEIVTEWVWVSPPEAPISVTIPCIGKYTFYLSGSIDVSFTVLQPTMSCFTTNPIKLLQWLLMPPLPSLPRCGLRFALPSHYSQIQWFGLGPHEAYDDRQASAHLGLFHSSVEDLHTPYIFPQECGRRAEPRYVIFRPNENNKNSNDIHNNNNLHDKNDIITTSTTTVTTSSTSLALLPIIPFHLRNNNNSSSNNRMRRSSSAVSSFSNDFASTDSLVSIGNSSDNSISSSSSTVPLRANATCLPNSASSCIPTTSHLKGWGFSASRYSLETLEKTKHNHELDHLNVDSDHGDDNNTSSTAGAGVVGSESDKDDGQCCVHVHFDSHTMGIGGYYSWTPNVDSEYLVHPMPLSSSITTSNANATASTESPSSLNPSTDADGNATSTTTSVSTNTAIAFVLTSLNVLISLLLPSSLTRPSHSPRKGLHTAVRMIPLK